MLAAGVPENFQVGPAWWLEFVFSALLHASSGSFGQCYPKQPGVVMSRNGFFVHIGRHLQIAAEAAMIYFHQVYGHGSIVCRGHGARSPAPDDQLILVDAHLNIAFVHARKVYTY